MSHGAVHFLNVGRYSSFFELAGLVIAGGLLDDNVPAVEGVYEGDEGHQGGELILVIVPRVPCSVSSSAARSASVNTLASRQAAIRVATPYASLGVPVDVAAK